MAQCYAPEEVSAAVLISELASDLVQKEHQVTVITGAPSYPYGRVFPDYRNRLYQTEMIAGVRVVRTWSFISPHKTYWRRLLHYSTYCATALYGGLLAGKPDILVSFSPPLPLGLTAWLLSCIWQIPWVLQLEDLFPDAAIAAGMLSNRAAITFFSQMERIEYRRADKISVISQEFIKNLVRKGVPESKIAHIPIWADPDLVKPMPKDNRFRSSQGLDDKFIVMYAGNMGLTGCLEDVLYAAEKLQAEQEIFFLLIGEGVKKESFIEIARKKRLANIRFLPYQSRDLFPEMMATADVNLVTLNPRSAVASLPSKIFNIMSSARPILAIAPLESEIAQIVKGTGCGLVVPPENPGDLAEAIVYLKSHPSLADEMGNNGRKKLLTEYSRQHCTALYEKMLLALVNKDRLQSQTTSQGLHS